MISIDYSERKMPTKAKKPKSTWSHPDYKNLYTGEYSNVVLNDNSEKRAFILVPQKGKGHIQMYKSPVEAKKMGWKKI